MKKVNQEIKQFIVGLRYAAKIRGGGNCQLMSELIQTHLFVFYQIRADIINCKVTQGDELINHYYIRMPDKTIIDGTSSQFKNENGKMMPKVYIGEKPSFYTRCKKWN